LILITSGQQNRFKFAAVTAERPIETGHPTPAHAVWQRALRSYTHASLTNTGDKPIALSGIASELAHNLSNDYIAGLWVVYRATSYYVMSTMIPPPRGQQSITPLRSPGLRWMEQ
jgi:hypothetical protein